jgi:hypothetical protein
MLKRVTEETKKKIKVDTIEQRLMAKNDMITHTSYGDN